MKIHQIVFGVLGTCLILYHRQIGPKLHDVIFAPFIWLLGDKSWFLPDHKMRITYRSFSHFSVLIMGLISILVALD